MSTTLTNGLKLPDKGSVDWYADMQNNYQILDNAVGTVAEHTTALAGKAPSSHTHGNISNDGKVGTTANQPLITGTGGAVQAGSFGNAANTFCEGNDSRLSDARTPVAHTHTKSDVTDLLNSDFIPSANNSYDLGSSSYQWNNLYANNYFYNGTAWGLDKVNVWTNRNILEAWGFTIREKTITDSTPPSSDVSRSLIEVWGNDFRYWGGFGYRWGANGVAELVISNSNWNGNTQGYWEYTIGVNKAFNSLYFNPPNGISDLGTSDHKWKTLNGVNPGALGIPDKDNKVNIASEFTDLTGGNNFYTPPADGFVSINADTEIYCAVVSSTHNTAFWRQSAVATTTGYASVTIPVRAGLHLLAKIKSTGAIYAEFYPCLGNV